MFLLDPIKRSTYWKPIQWIECAWIIIKFNETYSSEGTPVFRRAATNSHLPWKANKIWLKWAYLWQNLIENSICNKICGTFEQKKHPNRFYNVWTGILKRKCAAAHRLATTAKFVQLKMFETGKIHEAEINGFLPTIRWFCIRAGRLETLHRFSDIEKKIYRSLAFTLFIKKWVLRTEAPPVIYTKQQFIALLYAFCLAF